MMTATRWSLLALAAVGGTIAAATGVGACDSCKAGVLTLRLGLLDESPQCDTITVEGHDPGATVMASFPHTPNPDAVAAGVEHVDEQITLPAGFPKDAQLHLVIRALLNGQVIGENSHTTRLDGTCGDATLLVSARYGTDDDAGANGGF